jgi:hypothetical protein
MKPEDKFWHDLFLNPLAWFFVLLLLVTAYQNHLLKAQLNVVCDAIEMPRVLQSSSVLEKAQGLCEDRPADTALMPVD